MLQVLLRVLPGQVLPQQQMNPMDLEVPRKGLHGDKVQYCQTVGACRRSGGEEESQTHDACEIDCTQRHQEGAGRRHRYGELVS